MLNDLGARVAERGQRGTEHFVKNSFSSASLYSFSTVAMPVLPS